MIVPPPSVPPKVRKRLSADALYALLRDQFGLVQDHRQGPAIPQSNHSDQPNGLIIE